MIKWVLIGGLLAAFGFSELNLGSVAYGVFALGVGFLGVAIALEFARAVFELAGRLWDIKFQRQPVHSINLRHTRSVG